MNQEELNRMKNAMRRQEEAFGACIITWEMLRRLGFDAEQLFFISDERIVGMALRIPESREKGEDFNAAFARGGKQVAFGCGAREREIFATELGRMWGEFADKWNRGNDIYRSQLFARHASIESTLSIVLRLAAEKIHIPNPTVSGIISKVNVSPLAQA